MNNETLISYLSLTSIIAGFPAIVMIAITVMLVMKAQPRQTRQFIIENTPPPPKPPVPKRRVVTCTIPEDIQQELDRMLKSMEGGTVPGWFSAEKDKKKGSRT